MTRQSPFAEVMAMRAYRKDQVGIPRTRGDRHRSGQPDVQQLAIRGWQEGVGHGQSVVGAERAIKRANFVIRSDLAQRAVAHEQPRISPGAPAVATGREGRTRPGSRDRGCVLSRFV